MIQEEVFILVLVFVGPGHLVPAGGEVGATGDVNHVADQRAHKFAVVRGGVDTIEHAALDAEIAEADLGGVLLRVVDGGSGLRLAEATTVVHVAAGAALPCEF